MKILVVCQLYYPDNFQVTPICEQLVQDGYEVTVLTGLPNYPSGIIPEEYKKGHRDEYINGVHVIRTSMLGRKKGVVGLAMNFFSFWHSANRRIMRIKNEFDLVFVYQLSPVMMGLPAVKYAKKHKLPLALYCCDLWPESMKIYVTEKNIGFKIFKKVSKKVYAACDRIMCQSTSFLPYLENTHGISRDVLRYVPAFADEAYVSEDFTPTDDRVDFVFLGNHGMAQNLIAVLTAVEKIKDTPNFMVHFVGNGSCLDEMKRFVAEHHLENVVTFYGQRPVEEMPIYYKMADVCLVSLRADSQVGLTLPSKVQGYMSAGKPLIGMIDGSAREAIEDADCGICVGADDIDGLASAMKYAIEHKEMHKTWGQNARAFFLENFRKGKTMAKLENELESLVGEKEESLV